MSHEGTIKRRGRGHLALMVIAAAAVSALAWIGRGRLDPPDGNGGDERASGLEAEVPAGPGSLAPAGETRPEAADRALAAAIPPVTPGDDAVTIILELDRPLPEGEVVELRVTSFPYSPPEDWHRHRQRELFWDTIWRAARGEGAQLGAFTWTPGVPVVIPAPTERVALSIVVDNDFLFGDKAVDFDPESSERVIRFGREVGAVVELQAVHDPALTAEERGDLAGMSVALASAGFDDRVQVSGGFTAEGTCLLSGLPPGRYGPVPHFSNRETTLEYWANGDEDHTSPFRPSPGLTFEAEAGQRITVPVPVIRGRRLFGQVIDEGPVERADVEVRMREGDFDWLDRTVRTDVDGRFEFEGLARDVTRLEVSAGGHPDWVVMAREGESLDLPEDEPLLVDLSSSATVEYRVVDPEGRPVEGAQVRLACEEFAHVERAVEELTDADGVVTVRGMPWVPHVACVAGDWRPGGVFRSAFVGPDTDVDEAVDFSWYARSWVAPGLGEERHVARLVLERVPTLTVRLVGACEGLVPVVRVKGKGPDDGRDDPETDAFRRLDQRLREQVPGTLIRPILPGRFDLMVRWAVPGRRSRDAIELAPIDFEVAEGDVQLDVPAPPLRAVGGALTDDLGAPVEGATISLMRQALAPECFMQRTTDARGQWECGPLVPGRYRVTVTSDVVGLQDVTFVDVPPGGHRFDLDLFGDRKGTVELTVDFRAEPPGKDSIILIAHPADRNPVRVERRLEKGLAHITIGSVTAGANEIRLATGGTFQPDEPGVASRARTDVWLTQVEVPPGATIPAQLVVGEGHPFRIAGRIEMEAGAGRKPRVSALIGEALVARSGTDAHGRFEMWVPRLDAARLQVVSVDDQVLLEAPVAELQGPGGEVVVKLPTGGIEVSLTPAAEAAIHWESRVVARERGTGRVHRVESVFGERSFILEGLPPGTYVVDVARNGSDEPDPRFRGGRVTVADGVERLLVRLATD